MLKNKIALKRLRNVIFLGLILVIMLGIYNNTIRNSKAEDVTEITVLMEDPQQLILDKEIKVNAIKNVDAENNVTYSIQLTDLVDGKKVNKYWIKDKEEVQAIAGTIFTVNESDIVDGKIQMQLEYDRKIYPSGEQTLAVYNQTLTSSAVTVSGYVPEKATLKVQDVDLATLSDITLPDQNVAIEKAYDITIDNSGIAYEPNVYGESVNVVIAHDSTNTPIVYHVSDDNTVTKIDSVFEGRSIKFTANQFSKYLIATQTSSETTEPENETTNTVDNTIDNTVDTTNTITNTVEDTENTNTVTDEEITDNTEEQPTESNDKELPVWSKVSSSITETGMDVVIQGTDNEGLGFENLKDSYIQVWIDGEKADSISESDLENLITELFAEQEKEIDERIDSDETKTEEEKAQLKEEEKAAARAEIREQQLKNRILVKLQNREEIVENIEEQSIIKGVKYTVSLSNMEQSTRHIKPETAGTEDEEYKRYIEWSGNVSLEILTGTLTDMSGNVSEKTIIEDTEKTDRQIAETADKMFRDVIKPEISYQLIMTNETGNTRSATIMFDIVDKYFSESTLTAENITLKIDEIEDTSSIVTKTLTKLSDLEETIDGVTKKIGERYQLVLNNIQDLKIEDGTYYGPIQLIFTEGVVTDTSGNTTVAKTITSRIDDPDAEEPGVAATLSGLKWRIFYNSGSNVFLILDGYLDSSLISSQVQNNLGLTKKGTYNVYWSSPNYSTYTTSTSSKFMATKYGGFTQSNGGYKAASGLLATSQWTSFVNSGYAESAVGSPTLEMWAASWNAKNSTKVTFDTNNAGFYLKASDGTQKQQITVSNTNKLYFPYTDRVRIYKSNIWILVSISWLL